MADDPFQTDWAFILQHPEERIRTTAQRAALDPVLRRLFPFTSIGKNVLFSTTSIWPYDVLPYIASSGDPNRYAAWDAVSSGVEAQRLGVGDLETVVTLVSAAILKRLPSLRL